MTLESASVRSIERSKAKKKKQLIAVGILSLLLVGLLIWPSQSEDAVVVPNLAIKPASLNSASQPVNAPTESTTDFTRTTTYSSMDADALFAVDLFRGPDAPVAQAAESIPAPPAVTPYAVGAVYGSIDSTDKSALIDGDIVRSGDLLHGENRVLSISTEGVTLSK